MKSQQGICAVVQKDMALWRCKSWVWARWGCEGGRTRIGETVRPIMLTTTGEVFQSVHLGRDGRPDGRVVRSFFAKAVMGLGALYSLPELFLEQSLRVVVPVCAVESPHVAHLFERLGITEPDVASIFGLVPSRQGRG